MECGVFLFLSLLLYVAMREVFISLDRFYVCSRDGCRVEHKCISGYEMYVRWTEEEEGSASLRRKRKRKGEGEKANDIVKCRQRKLSIRLTIILYLSLRFYNVDIHKYTWSVGI